jgi:hypothetical protein
MLAAQQQPRHCGHRQLPLAIVGSHIMHNHAQHSCRPGVGPYSASSRGGASRGARARARCGAPARRAAAARALGPGGGQPRAPGTRATPAPWARPGPAAPALRPADWSNRDVGGRSCTPDASQNSGLFGHEGCAGAVGREMDTETMLCFMSSETSTADTIHRVHQIVSYKV